MKSPKPEPLHCFMKLQHKSQRIKMAQREREERKKTGTFFDRLEIDQNFDMLPFRSGIFQSPVLVKFGETQSSHIINTGWNLHLTRLYVEQFSARNSNSCCELHERFQINSVWGTYVCVHFERYTFSPQMFGNSCVIHRSLQKCYLSCSFLGKHFFHATGLLPECATSIVFMVYVGLGWEQFSI